jgi:hypothetical protein
MLQECISMMIGCKFFKTGSGWPTTLPHPIHENDRMLGLKSNVDIPWIVMDSRMGPVLPLPQPTLEDSRTDVTAGGKYPT